MGTPLDKQSHLQNCWTAMANRMGIGKRRSPNSRVLGQYSTLVRISRPQIGRCCDARMGGGLTLSKLFDFASRFLLQAEKWRGSFLEHHPKCPGDRRLSRVQVARSPSGTLGRICVLDHPLPGIRFKLDQADGATHEPFHRALFCWLVAARYSETKIVQEQSRCKGRSCCFI